MSLETLFRGDALVPGVLRGYRTWELDREGNLRSTGVNYTWVGPGRRDTARCIRGSIAPHDDPAPSTQHLCGFYGWYDPADSRIVNAPVFGAVEVSGRVILGSHGFRAEHVRVLAVTSDAPGYQERLHTAGWPLVTSRPALLEQYPPHDVSQLVPHQCDWHCPAAPPLLTTSRAHAVLHRATDVALAVAARTVDLAMALLQAATTDESYPEKAPRR